MTEEIDCYFSADVETDGPIPGPFSMLSFALVLAGRFGGDRYERAPTSAPTFYAELRPISGEFDAEALRVNGLDRDRLQREGLEPAEAMSRAAEWIREQSKGATPILVAYPLSFDWAWLYWYFTRFSKTGSPFNHSRCFDLKTAFSVKARSPVCASGRDRLPPELRSQRAHTHNALDDAMEQAEIFARLFSWSGR